MSSVHGDTHERILQATLRLMENARGQGVRLEDVARAAGVSRQAVYLHFGSRTELFIATARYLDDVSRLQERLQAVRAAPTGALGVDAFVAFWASYVPDIYGLAKVLLALRETDEAAAAAWTDRMAAMLEGCVAVLQCAQREGSLAPEWTVEAAADFFWAALSIPVWEQLTIERGWSQEQYIERMQRAIKRALLRDAQT